MNSAILHQKYPYLYRMKVDKELIDKLAGLSKLQFDAEEEKAIEKNLSDMLEFVGKLNEVDVEGVEPLVYMSPEVNILREDVARTEITREEALKNAPLADSDYFKVPKVIRKG